MVPGNFHVAVLPAGKQKALVNQLSRVEKGPVGVEKIAGIVFHRITNYLLERCEREEKEEIVSQSNACACRTVPLSNAPFEHPTDSIEFRRFPVGTSLAFLR
jgi:hypothetical protein